MQVRGNQIGYGLPAGRNLFLFGWFENVHK
jgi:hypothetical protein